MKILFACVILILLCGCSTAPKAKPVAQPPSPKSIDTSKMMRVPPETFAKQTMTVKTMAASGWGTGLITLSWTASPSPTVTGYHIYRGPTPRAYDSIIDVGNVTTYTITNVPCGTTFYYTADAYDIVGQKSVWCNEVTNSIPFPSPQPPSGLNVVATQAALTTLGPWQTIAQTTVTNTGAMELYRLEITGDQLESK